MSDKHARRIKQYFEDLIEERDDLVGNVGALIKTANLQVQNILKSQSSLSEKEAVLNYLSKILVLFSDLNHSVLKNLETVKAPIPIHVEDNLENLSDNYNNNQELQDYLKPDDLKLGPGIVFDLSKDSPKIPNDQVQNDFYVRKPLDDTTLKVICSTFIDSNTNLRNKANNNTQNNALISQNTDICSNILRDHDKDNPRVSPTLSCNSESDIFSTITTTTYQHPLLKFRPSKEIAQQYDREDSEKWKENMNFIKKKIGFDPEGFAQMISVYDKPLASVFQYEEPVKDVQRELQNVIEKTEKCPVESNINIEPNICTIIESSEKLNNVVQSAVEDTITSTNNHSTDGPSISTGAIRKQSVNKDNYEDIISTVESESCQKVTSWLSNNSPADKKCIVKSELSNKPVPKDSAIEKLGKIKRHDRNEAVREKAMADMPDIKFVSVIKNDLNSDGSSSEKGSKKREKKLPNVKELNKEISVFELQQMPIPQNGDVCIFSHIVSPNEFYLQLINDTNGSLLDLVSGSLQEKFNKTNTQFKTKQEAFAKLGKFCCGYIWGEKKAWYRLQVLDWKLDCPSEEVEVQAVDFGFKCTTMYIYLRELSNDLAQIPILSIKSHFPLLYPPGSTYSERISVWPISTIEVLYNIANISLDVNHMNDVTYFELVFAMLDGDSLAVDLAQYPCSGDIHTVGQLLVDMELAVEIYDDFADNPELGQFLEDVEELEKADNLNEFLLGYDAKDEARICRHTRKDGTCFKGKNCKLEHIQLKDGYTTDKTAVFYSAINDLILPCKGEKVQVLVTSYVDSCTYLVQIVRRPSQKEINGIVMDKDITDLMDAMNHPRLISKYKPFKIYPAIGEMVLAFHPIAKKWIRAAVRELNKNADGATLEVYSVDFGDEFLVNTKNIRMMNEDFMHVPFQIIQIYLDNYQHRQDCHPKKAKTFFYKHIANRTFYAYIQSTDLPYKVYLTTFKGREIGPTLIKEGFAEPRTIDYHISEDKDKRVFFALE